LPLQLSPFSSASIRNGESLLLFILLLSSCHALRLSHGLFSIQPFAFYLLFALGFGEETIQPHAGNQGAETRPQHLRRREW